MGAAGSVEVAALSKKKTYDRNELQEIFGDAFEAEIFSKFASSQSGTVTLENLVGLCDSQKINGINFNFAAVKSLWFTAAHGSRGRALVELKDIVQCLLPIFQDLYLRFTSEQNNGMCVSDFRTFVESSKCGIDDSFIDSNFYECTRYPVDEEDADDVAAIRADVGQFASAVVRIANACALQDTGESDKGLREQLAEWVSMCSGALQVSSEALQNALGSTDLGCWMRDAAFFEPPPSFLNSMPHVYLDLAIETSPGSVQDVGRVVIELNGKITPKAAYNFLCLCTGERGLGEVTRLPLCFRGSSFHRVISNMCIQGGDIADLDGFGGESVYGGEFSDENFTLPHSSAGVVSMGNTGPDTNTSQFFITLRPAPHLDSENCAFGKVISGMESVHQVSKLSVDDDFRPLQRCFVKDCGKL